MQKKPPQQYVVRQKSQNNAANQIREKIGPAQNVSFNLSDENDNLYDMSLIRLVNEQFKIVRANPGPEDDKGTWGLALQEIDLLSTHQAYNVAIQRLDTFFQTKAGQAQKLKLGEGFHVSRNLLIQKLATQLVARNAAQRDYESQIRMFDAPEYRLRVHPDELKSVESQWQTSWFLLLVFAVNTIIFLNPRIFLKLLFGSWFRSGMGSVQIGLDDMTSLVNETQQNYLGNATSYFDRLRKPSRIAACLSNRTSLEPLWSSETLWDIIYSTWLLSCVVMFAYCLCQLAVRVAKASLWGLDHLASVVNPRVRQTQRGLLPQAFVAVGLVWGAFKVVTGLYPSTALSSLSTVAGTLTVAMYALMLLKRVLSRTSYGHMLKSSGTGDLRVIPLYLVACVALWYPTAALWDAWTTGPRRCQGYLVHRGGVSTALATENCCHHSHRTPEHTRAVPFHRLGKLSEREDVDVGDPVGLLHELHHHHQQHRAKGQFGELQSPEEGRGGVAEFAATKVLRVNEAMAHNV